MLETKIKLSDGRIKRTVCNDRFFGPSVRVAKSSPLGEPQFNHLEDEGLRPDVPTSPDTFGISKDHPDVIREKERR